MDTRVLELPASHPRSLQWHNQSRDTLSPFTTGPHSRRTIVRKDTVGDPLLRPVDNVHITLPLRSGSQPRDIRPGCQGGTNKQSARNNPHSRSSALTIRLSHPQAKPNLPLQHIRQESPLLLLVAEVDHRRTADGIPTSQSPDHAEVPAARDLVNDDNVVEAVPFARTDVAGESLAVEIIRGQGKGSYGGISEFRMALVDLISSILSALLSASPRFLTKYDQ